MKPTDRQPTNQHEVTQPTDQPTADKTTKSELINIKFLINC